MKLIQSKVSKIGFAEGKITDFNEGTHFIFGKNNSGKTLIAKAFIDTVYPCEPSLLDSEAWDTMFATYTVFYKGSEIEIQRKSNKKIKIVNTSSDSDSYELSIPLSDMNGCYNHKILDALYALFDKEAFTIVSYIPSPLDTHYYKRDFISGIRKILLLDRSLYYCAFTKLYAPGVNKTETHYHNTVKEIQDKIKHCKTKLDLIEVKEQKIQKQLQESRTIKDKIATHQNALDVLKKRIDACNRYIDIANTLNSVTNQLENIEQQIKDVEEKYARLDALSKLIANKYPQFKSFSSEKRNNIHTMQTIYKQLQSISEEIETVVFNQENKNRTLARKFLIANIIFAFVILFVFFKSVPGITSLLRWVLLGLLVLVQIASIGYYYIYTYINSFSKLTDHLQQQKEMYQIRLQTLLQQNDILLDGITVDDIYEFLLQYFEEYNEYNEKQIDWLTIQKEIDDGKSLDELEEEKKQLEGNYTLLQEQLNLYMQEIGTSVESADQVINVKMDLQNELEEHVTAIKTLQSKLNDISDETPSFDEEKKGILLEMSELERELDAIIKKNKLRDSIHDSFTKAAERLYNDRFALLIENVKTMVHELPVATLNTVDESSIKRILSNYNSSPNAAIHFLVYFTTVFALYDMLKDELPQVELPLIIDDPFVLMDEDTMFRFASIMQTWAANRQIIVFTHNSSIKKMYTVTEL